MKIKDSKPTVSPEQAYSFAIISAIRNAGYLINRVSHTHNAYKITIHDTPDKMHTVQNGVVLHTGTMDEVNAYLRGMLFVIQSQEATR